MKAKYKLGVIGGMGPLATLDLMRRITEFTEANIDQDHIPTIIMSNPTIPDRSKSICEGGESPYPMLLNSLKDMEGLCVECIVIPCNTAHYYIKMLQEQTPVKIINMVEETVNYLKFLEISKVGVLGTDGLLKGKVYDEYLNNNGVFNYTLAKERQIEIMGIIKAIKANGLREEYKNSLHKTLEKIDPYKELYFILACTELSLMKDHLLSEGWKIIDAMDVLAVKTISYTGHNLNVTKTMLNDSIYKGKLYEFS